jgi:hypothetical protein
MIRLPEYARIVRRLLCGEHPFLALLPLVAKSPAVQQIESAAMPIARLLETARVRIERGNGYIWVDDDAPAIILAERYYRRGSPRDLYLDLLHELTHLRQLTEGQNLWNKSLHYVDRPTEIEGYAVAVQEGRRLGMTESDIDRHLSNPWMTPADVTRLRANVERFLNKARSR